MCVNSLWFKFKHQQLNNFSIRVFLKVVLSSPCLWACFHPPIPYLSDVHKVLYHLGMKCWKSIFYKWCFCLFFNNLTFSCNFWSLMWLYITTSHLQHLITLVNPNLHLIFAPYNCSFFLKMQYSNNEWFRDVLKATQYDSNCDLNNWIQLSRMT